MKQLAFVACVTAGVLMAGDSPGRRPFSPDDYYALDIAQDARLSPDGKQVAFSVASIERQQNRRHTEIWLAPAAADHPAWQLTRGDGATNPRWSPDGKTLAFLSARRNRDTGTVERAQVYALPMAGGEARRITNLKNGVTGFEWSPSGSELVCISRIGPSDKLPAGGDRSDLREYTHAAYKVDGQGFFDDRRAHLFVVQSDTGTSKQITFGDEQNEAEPHWSPDGTRIAYVSQRTDGNFLRGAGVYVVPSTGGPSVRISDIDVALHSARWSPDGARIAFIGSTDESSIPKIWTAPSAGGRATLVSNEVTYATELEWSGSNELIYLAAFHGAHSIFRINVATGKTAPPLTSRRFVRQMDLNEATGQVALSWGDDTHPGDVNVLDLKSGAMREVSHLNAKLLDQIDLQRTESFTYPGAGGLTIEGFFTKPASWQPGKTYPMILMIHGGPNGMWGYQWNHEIQAFAAHGWAVLGLNPRGSSGYGEAFQRAVFKEWGGKAYQDILDGVDAAIAHYPWVDRARLGVTGHSYGGFMTDWILGHTTRFKAACALAGISDFISVEGTRDGFYGHSRDFGGDVFENFDLYWKYSPVRYAKDVKTPTIVLHGESDQRVPLEQGEQFFRALRHFGVSSELVIFPREGHSLRAEPKHAVELARWQVYWFERFVEGNAGAVAPDVR